MCNDVREVDKVERIVNVSRSNLSIVNDIPSCTSDEPIGGPEIDHTVQSLADSKL